MVFCLNPSCNQPDNPQSNKYCQGCGSVLAQSSVKYLFRSHYQVIGVLGSGGFGRTYLAEDVDYYHRPCVIKKLLIQGSDQQVEKIKDLFAREGKQLDSLVHPQIPKLYAYFNYEDGLYLVQEYIDGQNLLQEFKQEGRFNQTKIRDLLSDILPVLAYIQDRQILHRDLKPENIMRRRSDGKLILIDFGASRVKSETGTQALTAIYTPGYAAIEHMQGRPKPASDIYSLGATCVRLLTGCLPCDHQDPIYDDYHNRWRWQEYLQNQGIEVNSPLALILNKMIDSSLASRYTSAQEVMKDLELLLGPQISNQTEENKPTIVTPPVTKIAKDKKSFLPWAILASVLGIGAIALGSKIIPQPLLIETNLKFNQPINIYEDSELYLVIKENPGNSSTYTYESTHKLTSEVIELKQSVCDSEALQEYTFKCTWSNQGQQYQVFYNPLDPSQIRLRILTAEGNQKQDRILTITEGEPLW